MFVIDVSLKNSPITLSVQRKTEEDAKALYQQILEALRSGNPTTLEMTCEVAAVQLSEKSSTATASGRPPGFFAVAAE
jgi:hypothetical protein